MDSSYGVKFIDLQGEYDFNINEPTAFSTILVDNIVENTTGNTVVFGSDITPDTNGTKDIGSASKRFDKIFVNNIDTISSIEQRIHLTDTSNQITLGNSGTAIIINGVPTASDATYSIPNVGSTGIFVMTEGSQTINGQKTFNNTIIIPSTVPLKMQFNGESPTFATFLTCPNPTGIREVRIPDSGSALTNDFILSRGTQTVIGSKTFSSAVGITATSNQLVLGSGTTTTINAAVPGTSRTYLLPDVGSDTTFAMLGGTIQTFDGLKIFSNVLRVTNTTDSTNRDNGALIVSGGIGASGNVYGNSFIAIPRSVAPTFGTTGGGFYIDSSNNMQFVVPTSGSLGTYAFSNNSGVPYIYMSPTDGLATGMVKFNFQKSLGDTGFPAIYNPNVGLADLAIFSVSSLSLKLRDTSTPVDYLTMDTTNGVTAPKRVRITDTTTSTSSSTGALVISGGLGVTGAIFTSTGITLPTTGGTATQMNAFEEVTHASVFTGPFTSGSITMRVKRINNCVSITFPQIQATATSSAIMTASSAIPTRFRPATEQTFGIRGISGGTIQMITARMQTSGVIRFERIDGTAFPSGTTCGTAATGFQYDLDL